MNYEELVKALRCKSLSKQCDSCKYGYRLCPDSECNDACHVEQIYADAADAIEELTKKYIKAKEDATTLTKETGQLHAYIAKLNKQIDEMQEVINEVIP